MYDEKFNGYIKPAIGYMKLREVKDVHLQRILNGQAGKSASHVKKFVWFSRKCSKRARQSRLIPYDPAELLELPHVKEGKRRSVTEEERAAILAVSEYHSSGLWILTLLYTGMRPGETAALTWSDVDFKRNEIHVHTAKESGSMTIKGPKTASGVRDIPIHPNSFQNSWRLEGTCLLQYFLTQRVAVWMTILCIAVGVHSAGVGYLHGSQSLSESDHRKQII